MGCPLHKAAHEPGPPNPAPGDGAGLGEAGAARTASAVTAPQVSELALLGRGRQMAVLEASETLQPDALHRGSPIA